MTVGPAGRNCPQVNRSAKYNRIQKVMAFSEIELKKIEKLVGEFCQNRVPKKIQNELRYGYRVEGQSIFVYEDRPRWDKPSEWLAVDFAKLLYIRRQHIWKLYWKRASGKWELYEPKGKSRHLGVLIAAIDEDNWGCFFG